MGYLCESCWNYPCASDKTKKITGCFVYRPKTSNGDKLRAMSDEELAATKKICRVTAENLDECEKWRFPDGSPDCYSCALDWLKQEAEDVVN